MLATAGLAATGSLVAGAEEEEAEGDEEETDDEEEGVPVFGLLPAATAAAVACLAGVVVLVAGTGLLITGGTPVVFVCATRGMGRGLAAGTKGCECFATAFCCCCCDGGCTWPCVRAPGFSASSSVSEL